MPSIGLIPDAEDGICLCTVMFGERSTGVAAAARDVTSAK